MIFILFSIVNISKKSTRYFNNITFKKLKNNLIRDKEICLTRNNSNNYQK